MADQKEKYSRENDGKLGRLIYGIFMVIVYIGVGILFFVDFFHIDNNTISYTVGGLLCAYGLFRAYRLYIGSN